MRQVTCRKARVDPRRWENDSDTRNWLAESLLRDVAGFHDREIAPTRKSPAGVPVAARAWLKRTQGSPAASTLPSGFCVVAGKER
jgi:hypothetical protein